MQKIQMASMGAGVASASGGWGNQTLNILFTIFIVAIVFGVMLIAVVSTNTTLQGIQNAYDTFSTVSTNSVSATNANVLLKARLTASPTGFSSISATNPLTVAVTGNVITTVTDNVISSISTSSTTYTYSLTAASANQVLASGLSLRNITAVTVTGALPSDTGGAVYVFENYYPYATNTQITPYIPATVNILSAEGTVTVSQPPVGSSSSSPMAVWLSLVSYLITLSNFVGIIILLAIIVVVVGVLYYFFGNRGEAQNLGGL